MPTTQCRRRLFPATATPALDMPVTCDPTASAADAGGIPPLARHRAESAQHGDRSMCKATTSEVAL